MAIPNYPGATWNPWEASLPLDINGDYEIANRGAAQINYVVLHTTEGYSAYDAIYTWANSANAGAHYIIDGGTIYQCVSDKDIAYHATNFQYNAASIGIEIVGFAGNQSTISDVELQAASSLVQWLCSTYTIPIYHDPNNDRNSDAYMLQPGIVGHSQVYAADLVPYVKTDPGFDAARWDYFISLVNGGSSQLPDLDVQNSGDSYPPYLSASSIVQGDSVTLTYRLSNWGPGSAGASTTGIYRSNDDAISTTDYFVASASDAALGANQGSGETVTFSTSGWAPGTYYIGAIANYNYAIDEGNYTNNPSSGVALTVTVPQAPEISVTWGGNNIADNSASASTSNGTDFGSVTQGSSAQHAFAVVNSGNSPLTLGSVSCPTGFTVIEPLSTSIAAGSSDTFTVQLNTATAGNYGGQISFATNDSDENPYNFWIGGNVTNASLPEISVAWGGNNIADNSTSATTSNGTDFGSVTQGSSAQHAFTVVNSGNSALTLGSVSCPTGFTVIEPLSTSISAGSSDTFTVQLNTATAGNYGGQISFATNDSDENPYNFWIAGTVTQQQLPDLRASSLILGSTSIVSGSTTTAHFTVSNIGSYAAQGSLAQIYLSTDAIITTSDSGLSAISIPYLVAGDSATTGNYTLNFGGITPGIYYVGAIADTNNGIAESNEGNNVSNVVTVTVTAPQLPDLQPVSQGLSSYTIAAGGNVTVSYAVANIENVAAGTSAAGIYLSADSTITTADTLLTTELTGPLGANGVVYENVVVTLPGTLASGTFYLGVIADYNNQLIETDETHNATVGTAITVTAPHVSGFAAPTLALANFGASASGGGWSSDTTYPRELVDVNHDGLADIVGFGNAGVYVSLSTGDGHFAAPTFALTNFGASASAGGWSSDDTFPRTLADVNHDGWADIVGFGNAGVWVSLNTYDGHFANPTLAVTNFGASASGGGWSSDTTYPRELADVNADGWTDVVGFGNAGVWVSLNTQNGHFANPTLELSNFGASASGGGWSSDTTFPRMLADVNHDGRADIVGFGNAGVWVSLASGEGHFANPTLALTNFGASASAGGWSNDTTFPRMLADANGDEWADIVGFGNAGVWVSLNTHDGHFANPTLELTNFGASASAGGWSSNETFPRLLADITGDHCADIVGFGNAGVYTSISHYLL